MIAPALKLAFAMLVLSLPVLAESTSVLMLSVRSECAISVISSTHAAPVSEGQASQDSGTIAFVYLIRTSAKTGNGNIQLQVADEAQPSGAVLSYYIDLGIGGTPTVERLPLPSSPTGTIVATFGPDQSSSKAKTGRINWSLKEKTDKLVEPNFRLNITSR